MADTNETETGFYGSSIIEVYDGHTDSVLCLRDVSGYTYRIETLPLQDGEYMFTIWAKATDPMSLNINMLGHEMCFDLPRESWTKLQVFNEEPQKDASGNIIRYVDITPVYHDFSDGVENALYLYKAMLELSDKASDWSPAPEDSESDILELSNRISQAELKITDDSIISTVLESNTYKNSLQTVKDETASVISQTTDEYDIRFDKLESTVNANDSYVKSSSTWINFDKDGMHIGKEGTEEENRFTMDLSNQELAFNDNNMKVAYINNQTMHITNAEIDSLLRIGKFAFMPTDTGMALVYVG